jgi:TorA maturation chaperone TorD
LPPDAVRLDILAEAVTVLEELGVGGYAFASWLDLWSDELKVVDRDSLPGEHVRLFESGMDLALCPLVESHYTGSALAGGPARLAAEIERVLADLGLELLGGQRTPDHLTVELEAMAVMCGQEAAAWEEGSTAEAFGLLASQEALLAGHLAIWVTPLAEAVEGADRTGFYGSLARAMAAFVEHDLDLVRELRRPAVAG